MSGFRLRSTMEAARGSLGFLPGIAVVLAVVSGLLLPEFTVGSDTRLGRLLFSGGPEAARGILQAVAGSVITVTTLTFSLTVVTLQLASSQFSPRLLRTFVRDPVNQVVLAVFLATFVYSLTVLRTIRSGRDGAEPFVPSLAVTVALVLVLASVAALVMFISHQVRQIRVDTMMQQVRGEAAEAIPKLYPDDNSEPAALSEPPPTAVRLQVRNSGFVQAVSLDRLLGTATEHGVVLRLAHQVGDYLVAGTPLGWIWPVQPDQQADRGTVEESVNEAVEKAITGAVQVGFERTMQADVGYALRQLVDIAAKALSPGINDPTTAVHATKHLSVLLSRLAERRLTSYHVRTDDDDRVRVIVPRPDFPSLLDLSCGQIRRYGASEPAAIVALLRLLRDVGWCARTERDRAAIRHQCQLATAAAEEAIAQPADLASVRAAAAEVSAALRADGAAAYAAR